MSRVTKRQMIITIDGVDYSTQISNFTIEVNDAPTGFVSFAAARSGGSKQWSIKFTAAQDTVNGSVWDLVWSRAGETIPVRIAPTGDVPVGVNYPAFTMMATIDYPSGTMIGSEADRSTTAVATFDAEFVCTAKPVKVTS